MIPERRSDMPDVAHYQGVVDFDALPLFEGFIAKATQGTSRHDPQFVANRDGARRKGIPRRVWYHFPSGDDAETQARFFAQTIGPLQPGEGVMLDLEPDLPHGIGVLSWRHINDIAQAILRLTHVPKIIAYAGLYYPGSPPPPEYVWILPHYGSPRWSSMSRQPDVWQWTSQAHVDGIVGNVDMNSILDMQAFDSALVAGHPPIHAGGKDMTEFVQLDDTHPPEEHYPVFLSSGLSTLLWMQNPQQYADKLQMLGWPADYKPHQVGNRADLKKWGEFFGPLPPGWTA